MKSISISQQAESEFQKGDVGVIAGGHFVHDIFTAFVAPLLPEIIKIMQITLTQAGTLSAFLQVPSLLNPIIGYIDDRRNLRTLLILAPGMTATFLSFIGLAPNYTSLVFLFLIAGISVAVFHATAPSRLARLSGNNIGLGMSLFMGGGELGRTLGPLLAVWAVSLFTIRGIVPLALIGWIASLILWLRLKKLPVDKKSTRQLSNIFPGAFKFFLPVAGLVLFRGLMITSLGTYLPTFLTGEGANLWAAGSSLAIYQLAGSAGAIVSGTLSDKIGRRKVLTITIMGSSLLLLLFLASNNWLTLPLLILLGFLNLTMQPVMLALVQDYFPNQRSMANGSYMTLSFIGFSITSIAIGAMGDWLGLRDAFFWCSLISLLALPMLYLIPKHPN